MKRADIEKEWQEAVAEDLCKHKDAQLGFVSGSGNVELGDTKGNNVKGADEGKQYEHDEHHFSGRTGWLRAMVLGANDGLVSVGALMLGIAGATLIRNNADNYDHLAVVLGGIAALVAGAFSMACGEFVSVYSQRDSEKADIAREKWELLHNPDKEKDELVQAYQAKGLSHSTAKLVATELMCTKTKALQTHLAEELHMDQEDLSNPLQAAVVSAIAFSVGAAGPLIVGAITKTALSQILGVIVVCCVLLIGFGVLGAHLGGARKFRAGIRVLLGGVLAMGATFGVGCAFGVSTG